MKMFFWGCLLGVGGLTASCSSDSSDLGKGTGIVSFELKADPTFVASRAVDESYYSDVKNYTVVITKDGKEFRTYDYPAMPSSMDLEVGSYHVQAYCGEDVAASTKGMYVVGDTDFTLTAESPEATTVTVNCAPVCAKVKVNFAAEMAEYFSDYSVKMETSALTTEGSTFIWTKDAADPVYLKVGQSEDVKMTISLTKKSDSTQSTVEKTYTLSPKDAFTLNINPVVQDVTGNLGISITVDESTNDKPIDIIVPSDWWN
ncbi:DUF4493 domain-containing protein [uncultured Bacteroides sp.]|uniref:DUF4493 domain-containing protein n=1 Tax=uncultured Bacteroides sp. TaxID=162156 RepID=UPI002614B60D|nr:DUF4493 domain-containing protein [uncultured Bacteroides sp.]